MTLAVRAVFWVIAYLGAVLVPLVFAVIGANVVISPWVNRDRLAPGVYPTGR